MSRKKKFLTVLILVLVIVVAFFLVILPQIVLKIRRNNYLQVMKNLNQTETKDRVRELFDRDYNYSELLI